MIFWGTNLFKKTQHPVILISIYHILYICILCLPPGFLNPCGFLKTVGYQTSGFFEGQTFGPFDSPPGSMKSLLQRFHSFAARWSGGGVVQWCNSGRSGVGKRSPVEVEFGRFFLINKLRFFKKSCKRWLPHK